jgi:hypothetical protein
MCEVWKGVWPQLARGGTVCKVTEYVKMLSAEASVLNLAAVSFERYFQGKRRRAFNPKQSSET